MCDLIQITTDSLFKQVSSQQPATPLSQGTNSTTLSQKSQTDQFEMKAEDSPSTSSSTQTLEQSSRYDKKGQTQSAKENGINIRQQAASPQSKHIQQSSLSSSKSFPQQQLLQQYQHLDKLSLIQMLIEEKKKNQNLLNAYTRDTEKLKSEILEFQKELIKKQDKEFQKLNSNMKSNLIHKHTQSACNTLFNSCNSEQVGITSSICVENNLQKLQHSTSNAFTHTFSNLKTQQFEVNTFNNINLIQSYTPSTTTSQSSISHPIDFQRFSSPNQRAQNMSLQKHKLQSQDIISPTLQTQSSPKQKLTKSIESNSQSINPNLLQNTLSKSTTEYEMKNIQTIKLLKFLEDLVIKCSPNNMFKENERPSEKQIWKFVKTMTEEYVAMKKQDILNSQIFSTLKDIFKASSLEKVIQLARLQKEEVSILRKKMYIQPNQVAQ